MDHLQIKEYCTLNGTRMFLWSINITANKTYLKHEPVEGVTVTVLKDTDQLIIDNI